MDFKAKGLKVFLVVSCALVFGSTTAFSAEWQVPAEWKFLKFAGGAVAGAFTPLTAKISELINKNIPGVNASSTPGGGYSNMEALNAGKIQLGMCQTITVADVYYGLSEKYKGKELTNIRHLGNMHPAMYHIYAPKNSPIKNLCEEVSKKPLRIAVGPLGSSTYMCFERLLKVCGTSIKDLEARGGTAHKVYWAEGVNMMKDGHIDFMAHFISLRGAAVMDAASSPMGIRLLELSPQERARLMDELFGTVEYVIPKGIYPGVDRNYQTIAHGQPIVVNKDMPEELAYRITRVIWENLKEIRVLGSFAETIKLEDAFAGNTIPLHPGAERYYREKGLAIPPLKPVPKM